MTRKRIPTLKIELLNDRCNLLYLSLVEYKMENYLCIVDNVCQTGKISVYVLDFAEQNGIPLNQLFSIVNEWFYSRSETCPLSVELASKGLTEAISPIYRTFETSSVSRIIGHAFSYNLSGRVKVKRRRVIPIPEGIEIRLKHRP